MVHVPLCNVRARGRADLACRVHRARNTIDGQRNLVFVVCGRARHLHDIVPTNVLFHPQAARNVASNVVSGSLTCGASVVPRRTIIHVARANRFAAASFVVPHVAIVQVARHADAGSSGKANRFPFVLRLWAIGILAAVAVLCLLRCLATEILVQLGFLCAGITICPRRWVRRVLEFTARRSTRNCGRLGVLDIRCTAAAASSLFDWGRLRPWRRLWRRWRRPWRRP